jgi:hypothetical protein
MKKTVLFIFILSSLIACKSKEDAVNPTPNPALVIVKESLGVRALSWIKPYLGKSSVTFEDTLGNKQIFDIRETPIRREFHNSNTYIADGETFELFLTQRDAKNNFFSFKPLGKNFIIFSNLDKMSGTTPNIVNLQFTYFTSEEYYWVQIASAPAKVLEYTYSPIYPIEGGDSFTFTHNNGTQTFYKSFVATQSKGIEYYIDDKNVTWKQVSIR